MMKSPKRWYWIALLVGALALGTAAIRVKGDSNRSELRKFQAEAIAALNADALGSKGTIKGDEIGTATIVDTGYAATFLGSTGNGSGGCNLGGGAATITTQDGSTLDMARQGMVCSISGLGLTDAVTGNNVYIITG